MEIVEDLKRIPHLKLDLGFDTDRLLGELRYIDEYVPHEVEDWRDPYFKEKLRNSWSGRTIIDYFADSKKGMTQTGSISKEDKSKVQITDLGQKCSYMVECVKSISNRPGRTRVAKLKAGTDMFWHSHCVMKNYENLPYKTMVCHVPLITNERAWHDVTSDWSDEKEVIYTKTYKPGEVWIFNSWYEHRAVNFGDIDRIHIVSYINLFEPKFLKTVKRALEKYNGPKI